jgi:hypothetical protein
MNLLILISFYIAADSNLSPIYTLVSPANDRPSGQIVRLNPDFSVTLAGTDGQQKTVKDVYSLRRLDRALPSPPTGPQLITTTGDRVAGTLLGGDVQSLRYMPTGIKLNNEHAWKVPLSSTAVVWLTTLPADTPFDPTQYDWLPGRRNRDVFRFRNNDVDVGTLSGLDADAKGPEFLFRPEQGGPRVLHGEELAAVVFNSSLSRIRKPKGPYARALFADSSRLSLLRPTIADSVLSGETLFGLKVSIPLTELVSMDVIQGKATYLSDLKPKKVEQSGFLGVTRPWSADRNVEGSTLRVATTFGEAAFDKGIGTHPHSALTFDLAGKYRHFEALVGLDLEVGIPGRVALHVLVDGKERDIPGITSLGAGNALPIRVSVQEAKEMVLITDYGSGGGVGANVNWCEARVVE